MTQAISKQETQLTADQIDADRFRKLCAAINHLGRLPTKFDEFIRVTAGSNAAGIADEVDKMVDYRLPMLERRFDTISTLYGKQL